MLSPSALDALIGFVWLAISISELAVAARVIGLGLFSWFKVFVIYLIADVTRSALLQWLGRNPYSEIYRDFWVASEPVLLILQWLIVLELYRALYKAYPGIHNFARSLIWAAIVVALLVTFGTVHLDIGRITWQIPDLQRLFAIKRLVSSSLGLLVLVTMLFFPRAPSARNILLHGWLLAALLIAAAAGVFFANSGATTEWPSLAFLTLQMACFLIWFFGLKRHPVIPLPLPAEEMARITRWNEELLEVARWVTRK